MGPGRKKAKGTKPLGLGKVPGMQCGAVCVAWPVVKNR